MLKEFSKFAAGVVVMLLVATAEIWLNEHFHFIGDLRTNPYDIIKLVSCLLVLACSLIGTWAALEDL